MSRARPNRRRSRRNTPRTTPARWSKRDRDGFGGFFAEALTLTRRRPDLAPLVERTIERLHAEGLRAYAGQIERHGWNTLRDPDATSRRFWALAIGVMVEGYAMGRSAEELAGEMLRVLGDQATTRTAGLLRLVGDASSEGGIQS